MRNPRDNSAGFALAFSLVFFAIVTFLLAGLFSMASNSARMSAIYMGQNRCRLAAQSAIEWVKPQLDVMFQKHTGSNGGASVRIGPKASTAYAWFSNSDEKTIGNGTYTFVLPATNVWFNGCEVKLFFGPSGQIDNSSSAIVSILARARYIDPNRVVSDVAIEERFRFGVGRSKVFDYAYFVNNYGWFQGTGCTANGDVRANGDMYLDEGCKVNGEVYAAQNDELGVQGTINSTGKMDSRSEYWNSSKTSKQSRPTSPPSNDQSAPNWVGGYVAPEKTATWTDLHNRTHAKEETGIAMPWIGDLAQYVQYAVEEKGTLSGGLRYSQNAATGGLSSSPNQTINAHYDGAGPSGNPALADKGAIVLEGTFDNPIEIKGPVVIDSDVIIKGYVTGQGTIYSGRNIHVVGNIQYKNPPEWSHPDTNPKQTAKNNSTKDLVGFAAKGNIVFSYDSNGFSGISKYLSSKPFVQQYVCDTSDKDIGYPRTIEYGYKVNETQFCGDYRAEDGGKMIERKEVFHQEKYTVWEITGSGWVKEGGQWKWKDYYGNVEHTKDVSDGYQFVNKEGRHYYDSVVEPNILRSLYDSNKKITRIDGVLYNNHGIFGYLGACTINGAMICRNEGIQYNTHLIINHDIRLREDSLEGLSNDALGMPVGASPPGVVSWHEIPISGVVSFAGWDWSSN